VLSSVLGGGAFGADAGLAGAVDLSADVSRLRWSLCPAEVERYRELGLMAGEGMGKACRAVAGGMTEHEVASLLCAAWRSRGIQPVVVLVAADERIRRYRHPIPTDAKVGRYVMVVGCARKWGLIASLTRLVHFGPVPADLRRRHEEVMAVDAAFIGGTAIGRPIGEAVEAGLAAYAASGFPDEWKLHHQGGPTGYAGREFRAAPGEERPAVDNQAFAWNPSITGTKSEDTFILTPGGPEIITAVPLWPTRTVQGPTGPLERPDILEL
jgi:antitoxin VapB